ncbi:MAG: four helix bundle protein [Candidatus Paceibacterota bacterium]|jgi:four helix bundle protein
MPNSLRERTYNFTLKVINLSSKLPNNRASWIISDQLIRSASSIGANYVEAQAVSSRLEYKKFFEISLKSANETKYWLSLLKDAKIIDREKVEPLIKEVDEICKMLGQSVITLKSKVSS